MSEKYIRTDFSATTWQQNGIFFKFKTIQITWLMEELPPLLEKENFPISKIEIASSFICFRPSFDRFLFPYLSIFARLLIIASLCHRFHVFALSFCPSYSLFLELNLAFFFTPSKSFPYFAPISGLLSYPHYFFSSVHSLRVINYYFSFVLPSELKEN